jgi:hypothetical protein
MTTQLIEFTRNGNDWGNARIDLDQKLSDLRKVLRDRSEDPKRKMLYSDKFLTKNGSPIEEFNTELDTSINEILKEGKVGIRGAPEPKPGAKRTITVKDGKSGSRLFTNQEESQTLYAFKQYLIQQTEIAESDIFLVGGADVQDAQARDMSLAEAADAAKEKDTITVKMVKKGGIEWGTAPGVGGGTGPKLPDWSETIQWDTPQYPTPTKFKGVAPTDPKAPEHKWSTLTEDDRLYVFTRKQLGSAIVFSKEVGSELDKASSNYKAVSINVAQPGVREQQLNARSSFLMTYSQTAHELRRRGMTSVSASVGAKGVAVKGGFSTSNAELSQTDRTNIYTSQLLYKPVVKLDFTDEQIKATESFTNAITKALNLNVPDDPYPGRTRYYAILEVLGNYGHFIPKAFMLGGALFVEEKKTVDKTAKIDEQSTSFSAGVGAAVNGVTAALEAGNTQELKSKKTSLKVTHGIDVTAIGGDTGAFSNDDPSTWLQSLRWSPNWSVIEYSDLAPTIQYLPADLLRACLGLIKAYWADPQTEERTVLNMLEYATAAESAWLKSQAPDALRGIYGGPRL